MGYRKNSYQSRPESQPLTPASRPESPADPTPSDQDNLKPAPARGDSGGAPAWSRAPLLIPGALYRDVDGGRWRVVRVSPGSATVRSMAAPVVVEIHTKDDREIHFARAGQALQICPRPIGWTLERE